MLYKKIKKIVFLMRDILEYAIYAVKKNKDYDIEYLKKITGLRNESELWEKINYKRKGLIDLLGNSTLERFDTLFPGRRKEKIGQAELVCEHIFDLLGSGPVGVSAPDSYLLDKTDSASMNRHYKAMNYKPIDWQLDFKSGYRWNQRMFFRWIKFGNIKGADVIVPWELSLFQDRMVLAQTYKLTNDQKFINEFQDQVNDWIENNRPGFGVNWICSMDIAMRAANWLVIKELFGNRFDFPKTFLIKFYGSLHDHGQHVRKHFQRTKNVTTNHYISELVGLLFIALYCPFFKKSKEWRDFAQKELESEIEKQIYSDGCDYEASTSYHFLALELFFYALLLSERSGIIFSESYRNRLRKMFDASLYCIKPNGMIPQIGDNGNRKFLKFSKRINLDQKYLLSLAAVYYKDSSFKFRRSDLDEDVFWIFGERAKTAWEGLLIQEESLKSKSFPDAGWYIIRHNNDYCFISCGNSGQGGLGGHAHNDKLSFELMLDGQDIIVDPGTYVYTSYPEERNKFRSTEYHNTAKFNDFEQNEFPDDGIFSLPDRVKIINAEIMEEGDRVNFLGEIRYADVVHKRIIVLDKKSDNWEIKDTFSCSRPVNVKLIFHLHPGLISDGNALLVKENGRQVASIKVKGCSFEKGEYDYSPAYGIKTKASCLIGNVNTANTQMITTNILKGNGRNVN
jgi:hypothetical protein